MTERQRRSDAQSPMFRVLGPLEVTADGRLLTVNGPRLRALLALLVAGAGRVVSVAALADGLWGPHPPPHAERTVRTYVSQLRRTLRPAAGGPPDSELIVTRPSGYALRLDPDAVDATRFEWLTTVGRQALDAGQPAEGARQLTAALDLWRGPAYDEFGDIPALHAEAARLDQARLAALADRIEADLATGMDGQLVPELEGLTGRHPGHQRLWGQLMTALYRAGRQTDALAAYRRARAALVAETGREPAPGLAEVHRQILSQDPRLLAARPAGPDARGRRVRPAQLPADARGFAGRHRELTTLDAALAGVGRQPVAVLISAVSGMAGVGKTALAVHWAYRVAGQFPDGQLYVNLRGFDPGGQAMAPAQAIRGFLDALGVPPDRIPASLDAQAALYRSTLDGMRMLVVLDNARDAEQARPLLPGTPTAMVVVTSRNQLTGLVAAEGARAITLDPLSTVEAYELLAGRLGPERVAAEPGAAEDIVDRCGRLPLALSIAGARVPTDRPRPLAALAAELAEAGGRLEALTAGDPASDVRAVFSWSYRALTAPAARLFRLLGLHPGPDVPAAAAASLAGRPPADTRALLAELARASLLTEHSPGRYTFHDLLRAYATDLAHRQDTGAPRHAATGRLLDHYTHTAYAADRLLNPHRDPIQLPLPAPVPGAFPDRLADHDAAMAWLTAEQPGLLAALRLALDTGHHTHAWELAWALDTFLERRGHWHSLVDAWQTALHAAGGLGDPAARAHAHRMLGCAHTLLGQYPEADTHLRLSLDLHARVGDPVGRAHTHSHLAYLDGLQGRPGRALDQAEQALALYRDAGNDRGQAYALNSAGWYHALLGDHARALRRCEQALGLFQQAGDRVAEADTWDSLGYAHHHLGHHDRATDCYRRALDIYRDLGDRYNQADTLAHLGDTQHAAGDPAAARATRQRALDILTELGHPAAADLRARLAAPEHTGSP